MISKRKGKKGEEEEREQHSIDTKYIEKSEKDGLGSIRKKTDSENKQLRTPQNIYDASIEQSPNRGKILYSALLETGSVLKLEIKSAVKPKQANTYRSKLFRHRNNDRTN